MTQKKCTGNYHHFSMSGWRADIPPGKSRCVGCGGRKDKSTPSIHALSVPGSELALSSAPSHSKFSPLRYVLHPTLVRAQHSAALSGGVLFHAWGAVDSQLQCSSNSRAQQMLPGELARIDWWGPGEHGNWKMGKCWCWPKDAVSLERTILELSCIACQLANLQPWSGPWSSIV